MLPLSALKPKPGEALFVRPKGPEVIERLGAAVSTVKERVAAEPSVLPTESVARTWKV